MKFHKEASNNGLAWLVILIRQKRFRLSLSDFKRYSSTRNDTESAPRITVLVAP